MKLIILDFFKNLRIINKYKKINSKLFSSNKKTKDIILVEFNAFHSDHLFFSYFSNVLSKKFDAKIVGFYNFKLIVSKLKENLIEKIKWRLSNMINYNNFGVYRSFGAKEIFKPDIDKNIEAKSFLL